jgi:uncharacterized protein HemX
MDTNPNNQTPEVPLEPAREATPAETSADTNPQATMSPLLAAGVLFALLLVAGGAYYYATYMRDSELNENILEVAAGDPQTEALESTSDSDDLDAIESDLSATSETDVESDMNTLDESF